jgi:hypothetical protein
MKRFLVLIVGLLFVGLAFTPAHADQSNSAVATVLVNISPNIAVGVTSPIVDMGSFQTGDIQTVVQFRVDANQQQIFMYLEASDLYKGGDPTSTDVAPIRLNTSQPAWLIPANGNKMGGGPNTLAWLTTGSPIDGFSTQATEQGQFESAQNGRFSQLVTAKWLYTQPDPEKPAGQYSGKVRLTAMIQGFANGVR